MDGPLGQLLIGSSQVVDKPPEFVGLYDTFFVIVDNECLAWFAVASLAAQLCHVMERPGLHLGAFRGFVLCGRWKHNRLHVDWRLVELTLQYALLFRRFCYHFHGELRTVQVRCFPGQCNNILNAPPDHLSAAWCSPRCNMHFDEGQVW